MYNDRPCIRRIPNCHSKCPRWTSNIKSSIKREERIHPSQSDPCVCLCYSDVASRHGGASVDLVGQYATKSLSVVPWWLFGNTAAKKIWIRRLQHWKFSFRWLLSWISDLGLRFDRCLCIRSLCLYWQLHHLRKRSSSREDTQKYHPDIAADLLQGIFESIASKICLSPTVRRCSGDQQSARLDDILVFQLLSRLISRSRLVDHTHHQEYCRWMSVHVSTGLFTLGTEAWSYGCRILGVLWFHSVWSGPSQSDLVGGERVLVWANESQATDRRE